ncbi:DUF4382 domain-containing protein [Vibrio sp.]|uniref:DUF4382 domain-containing protein n=1 Tax=Vibrio sp. TaxID=678 RepID=UPI003D129B7E
MNFKFFVPAVLALFALAGCGGGDGDSTTTRTSKVSFSLSDAPVDYAESVTIAVDRLELVNSSGQSIFIDVGTDTQDYIQLDLLDYQGMNSALIVSDEPIPVGQYRNLIMHIHSEPGLNFVIDRMGEQPLKQPSNKLRLGGFVVQAEAVQAFTIEFDLRMSMVMRGNMNNNNGYILKPHGVKIIANDAAVALSGTVDQAFWGEGGCQDPDPAGNMIYLYSGSGLENDQMIDLIDPSDEGYTGEPALPEMAVAPVASTGVMDGTGEYQFGYLEPGDYTVAFVCTGAADDPVQYNPEVVVPANVVDSGVTKKEVTLVLGQEATVDFGPQQPMPMP